MIMCTLLSMVCGYVTCFAQVTGICFKETALVFNVFLTCFVDFILCPTGKYIFKVSTKKNRLIYMCSSLKINTACHRSFVLIVDFYHSQHINIVFLLLTLNKHLFVSRVWKTSHNVLKTLFQGLFHSAIYHCTQLKQIRTTLSAYYDINELSAYGSALNLLWESQANNHRFVLLFDLLYHCYFPDFNIFCCVRTKTYLNHDLMHWMFQCIEPV